MFTEEQYKLMREMDSDDEQEREALEEEVARLGAIAHELADMEYGARAEQISALHHLGIIATDESLREHLERAAAFTREQHDRISLGESANVCVRCEGSGRDPGDYLPEPCGDCGGSGKAE